MPLDMVGNMEVDKVVTWWPTLTSTWKSNLVRELVTGVG